MDYIKLRIDLPLMFFNCIIPSGISDIEVGRALQYEAMNAAKGIEHEIFRLFSDEYKRQKRNEAGE